MGSAVLRSSVAIVALILAGCGGSGDKATTPTASIPDASVSTDAGAVSASSVDAAAPAPAKPFASSPMEATQLIGTAIDSRAPAIKKCVAEYRTRKKLPHDRVEITVGIDQEGRLLAATLKGGKKDGPFSECVQQSLADAPFPRSHAGVIQATKSYEEIEQ